MKIKFQGWNRNCGDKVVINRMVNKDAIYNNGIHWGDMAIEPLSVEKDGACGVNVIFSTKQSLNGDYLVSVNLSARELWDLLSACEDKPAPKLKIVR